MDDWKLFRSRIAKWQEDYMERLNKKYINILQGNGKASDKFGALDAQIKKDRKHPGVILSMSKSDMLYDITRLVKDGVIGMEDLEEFSEDLKEQVRSILKM